MLDAIYNKPNRILEKQKAYQQSTKPLWYRQPRSKFYVSSYYAAFTFGMVGTAFGIYSLIKGKKTE